MTVQTSLTILVMGLALTGCGNTGSNDRTPTTSASSAPKQPEFKVNTPGQGQAIVHVDSEAEASRVCDAAQAGRYDELEGVTQLVEKLPGSTPGPNTDGTNCMLPVR